MPGLQRPRLDFSMDSAPFEAPSGTTGESERLHERIASLVAERTQAVDQLKNQLSSCETSKEKLERSLTEQQRSAQQTQDRLDAANKQLELTVEQLQETVSSLYQNLQTFVEDASHIDTSGSLNEHQAFCTKWKAHFQKCIPALEERQT